MSPPSTVAAVLRAAPLARAVIRHAAPVLDRPEAHAARIRATTDYPPDYLTRRTLVRRPRKDRRP